MMIQEVKYIGQALFFLWHINCFFTLNWIFVDRLSVYGPDREYVEGLLQNTPEREADLHSAK